MKLRERRQQAGLSQVQLGIKAKVAAAAISDVERGVRKPWPKMARNLARALNVTVEELFPEEQERALHS